MERLDGRRLRAQQGRRHRFPDRRCGRQIAARNLSGHGSAMERREGAERQILRRRRRFDGGDAMDGRLRPRPHHASRATTESTRRCGRSPPPLRSRASKCASSRATTKCWRPRRPGRTGASISTPACRAATAARRRASSSPTLGDDYGFLNLDAERLRSHRPRRQRARRARARSTRSSIPSAASIAPARRCSSPRCCATPRAKPTAICR